MTDWSSCWGGMGMGWGMGFGWPFMILFWVLVVGGIVIAVRWVVNPAQSRHEKSALDILQERYARGEIQREEYEQKKRDLGD